MPIILADRLALRTNNIITLTAVTIIAQFAETERKIKKKASKNSFRGIEIKIIFYYTSARRLRRQCSAPRTENGQRM